MTDSRMNASATCPGDWTSDNTCCGRCATSYFDHGGEQAFHLRMAAWMSLYSFATYVNAMAVNLALGEDGGLSNPDVRSKAGCTEAGNAPYEAWYWAWYQCKLAGLDCSWVVGMVEL